jgi:hypothetical protein
MAGRQIFYGEGCNALVMEVAFDVVVHVGVAVGGWRVSGSRGIGVGGVISAVVGGWVVPVFDGAREGRGSRWGMVSAWRVLSKSVAFGVALVDIEVESLGWGIRSGI